MNRRNFVKCSSLSILALATGSVATITGCNVFSDILTWIPIGLTAINGIVTVLGPLIPPGDLVILTLVKAAFSDLSATVSEYNNDTNAADKATLLAKIRTILGDIVNNFQSFLSALNLGNNSIVAIVVGLANIIISALEGFIGQIPTTSSIPLTSVLHVGNNTMTVIPKLYKTVGAFKKDYNAIATANGHSEIIIH